MSLRCGVALALSLTALVIWFSRNPMACKAQRRSSSENMRCWTQKNVGINQLCW